MSSGTYFPPPVRAVEIPKKGKRVRVRIPMIPYTQSGVFGRGVGGRVAADAWGAYPVCSPPSQCFIDSLQALKFAVERVGMSC
jgi:hypothetical protein